VKTESFLKGLTISERGFYASLITLKENIQLERCHLSGHDTCNSAFPKSTDFLVKMVMFHSFPGAAIERRQESVILLYLIQIRNTPRILLLLHYEIIYRSICFSFLFLNTFSTEVALLDTVLLCIIILGYGC